MAWRWSDSWRDTGTHLCLKRHHHKHTWLAPVQWHLPLEQLSLPLSDHVYIKHSSVNCLWGPWSCSMICQLCCGSAWNVFRQLAQVLQSNIPFLKLIISFEDSQIYLATRLYCLVGSVYSQKKTLQHLKACTNRCPHHLPFNYTSTCKLVSSTAWKSNDLSCVHHTAVSHKGHLIRA